MEAERVNPGVRNEAEFPFPPSPPRPVFTLEVESEAGDFFWRTRRCAGKKKEQTGELPVHLTFTLSTVHTYVCAL